MAAATTIIAGGLIAGGGIAKAISGMSRAKKYQKKIENYDRQDLNNLADNIQLSTYKSDLLKEETARNVSTAMDNVTEGGQRAIIGATGKVADALLKANEIAGDDLNNQDIKRQYTKVRDGQRIRAMQERREEADLAGMGAMAEAGRQDTWAGVGDFAQAGMYAMRQDTDGDGRLFPKKDS